MKHLESKVVINKMMIIVDKPLLQIKDLRKGLKLKTPVVTSWSTSSGKSNKVEKKNRTNKNKR